MRAIERIYRAEAMRYLAKGRTSITCSALLSTSYLSEKGEVYPCTIWDKPLGNAFALSGFRVDADCRGRPPERCPSPRGRGQMPRKSLDALRSVIPRSAPHRCGRC